MQSLGVERRGKHTLIIQYCFGESVDFINECFLESFIVRWSALVSFTMAEDLVPSEKEVDLRRFGPDAMDISDLGPCQAWVAV